MSTPVTIAPIVLFQISATANASALCAYTIKNGKPFCDTLLMPVKRQNAQDYAYADNNVE